MATPSKDQEESASKDRFYGRLSALADEMIAAHGKDFTVGSLVLLARYIVQREGAEEPSSMDKGKSGER